MAHQQLQLFKETWSHRFCGGGTLRNSRRGRQARPLSTKDPLHLVFKVNKGTVTGGLRAPRNSARLQKVLRKYAKRFYIRIEQFSIQTDHIHILIRAPKRTLAQHFFRVLAGQFAQCLTKSFRQSYTGKRIWKHRPFSRVVRGWKPYLIIRDYIQLNEQEALGRTYSKTRLRGLSLKQREELWI